MSLTAGVEAGRGELTTGKSTGVCRVSNCSGDVRIGLQPVMVGLGEQLLCRADWGRLRGDVRGDGDKAAGLM